LAHAAENKTQRPRTRQYLHRAGEIFRLMANRYVRM
jgi:hypothetical protein